MRTIRIGSGAGYSGDRIEPAIELAEKGGSITSSSSASPSARSRWRSRRRLQRPAWRLRSAARRAHACRACRSATRRGIRIVTNMGAANPRRCRAKRRATSRGALGLKELTHRRGDRRRCARRSSKEADVYAARRRRHDRCARQPRRLRQCLYRCRADRRSARRRRRHRHHRPRRRSVAVRRRRSCTSSAGRWTIGHGSAAARSPAICSNAPARSPAAISPIPASRTSRSRAPRLSHRRDHADGALVVTQGRGLGRRGDHGDVQGAVALRDPRSGHILHAGRHRRTSSGDASRRSARDRVRVLARPRRREAGDAQGVGRLVDGLVGEGQISYAGPGAVARGTPALEIVRERLALTGVAIERIALRSHRRQRAPWRRAQARRAEPYEVRAPRRRPHRPLAEARRIGDVRSRRSTPTDRPAAAARRSRRARSVAASRSASVPRSLAQRSAVDYGRRDP